MAEKKTNALRPGLVPNEDHKARNVALLQPVLATPAAGEQRHPTPRCLWWPLVNGFECARNSACLAPNSRLQAFSGCLRQRSLPTSLGSRLASSPSLPVRPSACVLFLPDRTESLSRAIPQLTRGDGSS